MKAVQYSIENGAFRLIRFAAGVVSLRWAQMLGAALGRIVGMHLGFRRKIVLENLREAFPDRSLTWQREIAGASFASVGVTLFELLRFDRMSQVELLRLATFENLDVLREAASNGKGVILLSAHYGSWEIVPHAVSAALAVHSTILVRGLSNQRIDREVDRLRRAFGNLTVPSTIAVRELYRTLHRGGLVYMAADQSAPPESTRVCFFGRWTPAFEGPAVLALRTGAAIVFTVACRTDDGNYRMRFEPISWSDLSPDDPDAVSRLTTRCLEAAERAIRLDPRQWMWMHRRWKHATPSV